MRGERASRLSRSKRNQSNFNVREDDEASEEPAGADAKAQRRLSRQRLVGSSLSKDRSMLDQGAEDEVDDASLSRISVQNGCLKANPSARMMNNDLKREE